MKTQAAELLTTQQFLTAAGTETYLLFQQQFPLREFCAFEVFEHEDALAELERDYLHPLMTAAASNGHSLLLDAMLWRAHPDYIAALGYPAADIERLNRLAVARTQQAVAAWRRQAARSSSDFSVLIAADIGPRGDGYRVGDRAPGADDALNYHLTQIRALAGTEIDVVCAWTMTNANEAIGIARAAAQLELPVIISPTVETDGRLPDGTTVAEFIDRVDAATDALPIYYTVNCAHPTHLRPTLVAARERDEGWLDRFKGFRANSSSKSHAELDNSIALDRGNPVELSEQIATMQREYDLRLVGGCCGTDVEHIAAIARATRAERNAA